MRELYLKCFFVIFLLFSLTATSQDQVRRDGDAKHEHLSPFQKSSRVQIEIEGEDKLRKFAATIHDLSCGAKFVDGKLQLDLFKHELDLLDTNNYNYEVIIDDLGKYIGERTQRELPAARAALKQEQRNALQRKTKKTKKNTGTSNRSFSESSSTILSPIQYNECEEVDWIPQNFKLGTVGGAQPYADVLSELDLMRTMYPNLISIRQDVSSSGAQTYGFNSGGITIAPQTMWYVTITNQSNSSSVLPKPQSVITGAAHAREISSVTNIIYYMWYILENYESDQVLKDLIDHQELFFVPVINVDGYIYNESTNPTGGGMQRKNLRSGTAIGNGSRGVDLNRNSPYYWGFDDAGSSPTTTSPSYRGTSPASEPETQIIADFVSRFNFKTAVNHHAGLNSIVTSSYNGDTAAAPSGREDEYQELMQNITHYNRYIHGSAPNTLYPANGDFNDWMFGGPPVTTNPSGGGTFTSSGSGKNILAYTPENGDDFYPGVALIPVIAKRAVRMNLISSLAAGKYAQLHDFTPVDLNTITGDLDFQVEYIGQTLSDLTLTVTPISSNITITQPSATGLNGMSKLEQRSTSAGYLLDAGIQPNDLIEYEVSLSNDQYVIHKAIYQKKYSPTILADGDGIANWTGNWQASTSGYNGSTNAITVDATPPYGNNITRTTQLNGSYDLTGSGYVVEFNAYWDIERNFDLAQFEASIDGGTSWEALCGRYNKPASTPSVNNHFATSKGGPNSPSTFQSTNGEYVYDGDQVVSGVTKWVQEEMLIDTEHNNFLIGQNNVQFRFRFRSDGSNRTDGYNTDFLGFTFDDFKIISLDNYYCSNSPITDFTTTESFEDVYFDNWKQSTTDDGDFTRSSSPTSSGTTGPNVASEGNFFIFTEASAGPLNNNKKAILLSPCYDFTGLTTASFTFDYHMVGDNIGSLDIDIQSEDNQVWTNVFSQNTVTGTDQDVWENGVVSLNSYINKTVKLRITATTGIDFSSDIGLDNFSFITTSGPPDTENPVAICQDIAVDLTADGTINITATQIDNGSTDNVGIVSRTLNISSFDCTNIGANTVVLTITDAAGNTDTCTAIVTINPYTTPPSGLTTSALTATTATLNWDGASSDEYTIRFRESGTTTWTTQDVTTNSFDLTGLLASGTYEAQVRSNCTTGNTPFSPTYTFSTPALTNCSPELIGTLSTFTILNVNVNNGGIDNSSVENANDDEFQDFTSVQTDLVQGSTNIPISITVEKDYNGTPYDVSTFVWIDFNRNGILDDTNETIISDLNNQNELITGSFNIPTDATIGETRMRVSLKFDSGTDPAGSHEDPCADFNFGEYEDYTINITSPPTGDTTDPVALCQSITVDLDNTGNVSILASQIDNGSSDNIGIDTITVTPNSFTCAEVGANTVTLTVTDAAGNSDTCTATVTVEDNINPTIT